MSGLPDRPQRTYLPRDSELEEAKPMKRGSPINRVERDESPRRGRSHARARTLHSDKEEEDERRRESRQTRRKRRRSYSPEIERRRRKYRRSSRERSPSSNEDDYSSSPKRRHRRSDRERGRQRERSLSRDYGTRTSSSPRYHTRKIDDYRKRRSSPRASHRHRSPSQHRSPSLYSDNRRSPFLDSSHAYSYKINIPTSRVVSFLIGHGGKRTRDIVHRAGLLSLVFHNGRTDDFDKIPYGKLVGSRRAIQFGLGLIATEIKERSDATLSRDERNVTAWCGWDSDRLVPESERLSSERYKERYEHEQSPAEEDFKNEYYRDEDYRNEDYMEEEASKPIYSPAASTHQGIDKSPPSPSSNPSPPPTPTPLEIIPTGPRTWIKDRTSLQGEKVLPSSVPKGPKNPHSRPAPPIRPGTPLQQSASDERVHQEDEAFGKNDRDYQAKQQNLNPVIDVLLPIPNLKFVLGRIIGAQGYNIKELSRTTGASCFLTFHEGEPFFRACGSIDNVKRAIDIVDDHIACVIPAWPKREERRKMGYGLLGTQMPPGPYAEQVKAADFTSISPGGSQKEEPALANPLESPSVVAQFPSAGFATSFVPSPLPSIQTAKEMDNIPIEVNLPIPNMQALLGRVIGTGGSLIKQLMRTSGAHCFVNFSSGKPILQVRGRTSNVILAIDCVDCEILGFISNWPNREERKKMGYDLLGPQMPPEPYAYSATQSSRNSLQLQLRLQAPPTADKEQSPQEIDQSPISASTSNNKPKSTSPALQQYRSPNGEDSRHSTLDFISHHSSPSSRSHSPARSPSSHQRSLSNPPAIQSALALALKSKWNESAQVATSTTVMANSKSGAEGARETNDVAPEVTEKSMSGEEDEEMLDYSEDQPIDFAKKGAEVISGSSGEDKSSVKEKELEAPTTSEKKKLDPGIFASESVATFFFHSMDGNAVKEAIVNSLFSTGYVFSGYESKHPDSELIIAERNEGRRARSYSLATIELLQTLSPGHRTLS